MKQITNMNTETKTKWTAGPWRIEQNRRGYFNIVSAETGEHIAKVISTCRPNCEAADAVLLSLAPEWPEVLQNMLSVFSRHMGDSPEQTDALNDACALLAKLPK